MCRDTSLTFLSAQKEKVHCICKRHVYEKDIYENNTKEPLHDGAVLFVYRFYYLLPKRND